MSIDPSATILETEDIEVAYDRVIVALRGVSLRVARGSIVALLGANGAGKTTTLKAISRLVEAERGEVTHGSIVYDGRSALESSPGELVARGLVQVLEGRHCFTHLTVEENLASGTLGVPSTRAQRRLDIEKIYQYFPRLKERRRSLAGYLSGGEQQMLAIGRALMSHPRLVLLDEPSMGLAPIVVEEIFRIIRDLNTRDGVSFLLAEQNATVALRFADHGYILETGRVVAGGSAEELRGREDVREFYLGVGAQGRRSFRDASFDRRKPEPVGQRS